MGLAFGSLRSLPRSALSSFHGAQSLLTPVFISPGKNGLRVASREMAERRRAAQVLSSLGTAELL